MIKDFLSSSGAYIKLLILILIFINKSWAQILPSNFGVHHKKSGSIANYALSFDGSNDYISTGGSNISTAWTVEVWFKKSSNKSAHNLTNNANSNNSGTWSLRLAQWNNIYKVGITKYGVKDYYINDSKANLEINKWEHVAWTYENNLVTVYINGENLGTTFARGPLANGAILYWKIIGKSSHSLGGEIDEMRVWNDKRTSDEINDNMFIALDGNESNLVAYYKMSDGSGNSLTDNSTNSNTGTLVNGPTWVTSNAPIGSINNSYQTNIEALWEKTGTSESEPSDGLSMNVSSALAETNFTVYGNNGSDGTNDSDFPAGESILKRSSRIWCFDEIGTVTSDIKIDISSATGNSVTPSSASNYKLLYKSCDSCNFSVYAIGSSNSGDVVTFSNITIQDGFYAIATTDSNL
jgi:hypothetical protein